ncbi:MAG TPA: hypothetical protein VFH89_14440 [Sphingomicrobium sp.]|nr:hypothetical protein [Sphingomicrobium sp.]
MILFLSWAAIVGGVLLTAIRIELSISGMLLCSRGKVSIGSQDGNAGFLLLVVGILVGIAGLGGVL